MEWTLVYVVFFGAIAAGIMGWLSIKNEEEEDDGC